MKYIIFGRVYGNADKKPKVEPKPLTESVSSDYCLEQEIESAACSGPN